MGDAADELEAGSEKNVANVVVVTDGEDDEKGGGQQGANERQLVSVDDALTRWVGEFGKAQLLNFTLLSFAWSLEAIHALVTVFADRTPSWRCVVVHSNYYYYGYAPAETNVCSPSSSICSMDPRLWTWIHRGESTVSQWDLICGQSYKKGLVQSAFFVGFVVGAGLFGYLSDSRLGRKGALALSSACAGLSGMLTAASPNYGAYAFLRLLTGVSSGGLGQCSFVLATESIGPSKRSCVAMSTMYFYPLGTLLLCALATISSLRFLPAAAEAADTSWRRLYVLSSAPSLLYVLVILSSVAESPRWYLVRGRREEARKVLEELAKRNGAAELPGGMTLSVEAEKEDGAGGGIVISAVDEAAAAAAASSNGRGSLAEVFRRRDTWARIMILMVVWFACALGYYTLNLNVGNLGSCSSSLTVSLVLNAASEVPGYAVTTLLATARWPGRRRTLVGSLAVCGVICVIVAAAAAEAPYIKLVGSLVSLMAVAGAFNLLLLFTAELFPTVVRNAALGLATQASTIACIVSPFVALSSHIISPSFPFFLLGGAATLAALLAATALPNASSHLHDTLPPPLSGDSPSLME